MPRETGFHQRRRRREVEAWLKDPKKPICIGMEPVLTSYPKHYFAEPAMPEVDLNRLPDLIAYRNPDEVELYTKAFGRKIIRRLPNCRQGFEKLTLHRMVTKAGALVDDLQAVLVGPVNGLTVNDVKARSIAGHIPNWLGLFTTRVIVLEPDVSRMFESSYCLSNELAPQPGWRLAEYEITRKAQSVVMSAVDVPDDVPEAVETMSIDDSTPPHEEI